MKSPGITVRPIITIDGEHEVNEVFFDNVEVPADHLIGEENKGWTYAKYLLAHERTNIADVNRAKRELERLKRIAKAEGVYDDTRFRDQIAQLEVDIVALEMMVLRVLSAEEERQAGARRRRPAEDPRQRDPAALHRADDARRRPVRAAVRRTRRWKPAGRATTSARRTARRWRRTYFNMRKTTIYGGIERSAAQHRRADGARESEPWTSTSPKTRNRCATRCARWVDKGYAFERRRGIVKAGGFGARAWTASSPSSASPAWRCPRRTAAWASAPVEAMVVMEELGRGLVLEPYAHGALVAPALLAHAADATLQRAVAAEASPQATALVVLAHQERARALPPATTSTTEGEAEHRRLEHRAARRASCRRATRPTPSSCRRASSAQHRRRGRHRAVPRRTQGDRRARRAATRRRTARAPPSSRSTHAPATLIAAPERPARRSSTRVDVGIAAALRRGGRARWTSWSR